MLVAQNALNTLNLTLNACDFFGNTFATQKSFTGLGS